MGSQNSSRPRVTFAGVAGLSAGAFTPTGSGFWMLWPCSVTATAIDAHATAAARTPALILLISSPDHDDRLTAVPPLSRIGAVLLVAGLTSSAVLMGTRGAAQNSPVPTFNRQVA